MKKIRKKRIVLIIIIAIVIYIAISITLSYKALMVKSYDFTNSKVTQTIRIVQLSDNHNAVFGKDNAYLCDKIKNVEPDLILITGDLINSYDEDIKTATNLIKQLKNIAPVYISAGNHEYDYNDNFDSDVMKEFAESNAVCLDFEYEDIQIKGQQIRIGGFYGYGSTKDGKNDKDGAFLYDFQNTDRVKILMAHMPLIFRSYGGIDYWDVDYVYSGHTHGGQVILPFIGGLYAPDEGVFAGRQRGVFYGKKATLIISPGLGSSKQIVPRLNNIPQIIVTDINPEN